MRPWNMVCLVVVLTGMPPAAYEVLASSKAIARPLASSMILCVFMLGAVSMMTLDQVKCCVFLLFSGALVRPKIVSSDVIRRKAGP